MYKCKYCGKEFESKQKLGGHSIRCDNNPANQVVYYCTFCNKEFTCLSGLHRHEKSCKNNPARIVEKHKSPRLNNNNDIFVNLFCRFCGKQCKNENSLRSHERMCPQNPDKTYRNKFNTLGCPSWNTGLTKETDSRLLKASVTLSNNTKGIKRNPLSEQHKLNISAGMRKFLKDNPDKVPYKLNHSSTMSYPEQYFSKLFRNESFNFIYHYHIGMYELDFADIDKQVDIEIDGEQHYTDKRIVDSDIRHTEYLENLGWKIYRIRWSDFKKLSYEDRQLQIEKLKVFLNSDE